MLGTALLLRLAVVWVVWARYPPGWFFRTPGELSFLAQAILTGHGMSSPFGGTTGPTAFLAPGYPAIAAGVFSVFGSFTPASALAMMLLQTAFAMATVFLIVRIGEREFGAAVANVAGWSWAVGLPFLWLPIVFWDTSLSILLMAAGISLALRLGRRSSFARWAGAGVFGGLALVNPSLALVFVALFCWAVAVGRPEVVRPLLSVGLFLAITLPWPIRNQRALHSFIPLRSNFAFELWKGNRPGSTVVDDATIYPVFNRAEYARYVGLGEVGYMAEKARLAREEIAANRTGFARLTLRRFLSYWTGTGSAPVNWLLAAYATLTTVLGACGLVLLARRRRLGLAVLLALPLLLFPLPYYITHAELRFRLLVEPVTTLLAAYAAVAGWAYLAGRRESTRKASGIQTVTEL